MNLILIRNIIIDYCMQFLFIDSILLNKDRVDFLFINPTRTNGFCVRIKLYLLANNIQ